MGTAKPAYVQAEKFGTFGGVFTPSILTILGVIMFLRFPAVIGYAGLWHALLTLLAAKSISVITALSLASISTNMRVKGGGAYFLISRSLGLVGCTHLLRRVLCNDFFCSWKHDGRTQNSSGICSRQHFPENQSSLRTAESGQPAACA